MVFHAFLFLFGRGANPARFPCLVLLIAGVFQSSLAVGANSTYGQHASTGAVRIIATRLRGFGVPFNINADDSSYIEVQLFVSKDLGKSWQFHSRQTTDTKEFPFEADKDGEYWFALKTLDKDRKLVPDGQMQAELKIVIDTVAPKLEFNTDSDSAGRVVCSWVARDLNLDVASFKILYRDHLPQEGVDDTEWKRVPLQTGTRQTTEILRDQIAWWPESSSQSLDVRFEVADTAGNRAVEDRIVSVQSVAWRNKSSSSALVANSQAPRRNQRVASSTRPVLPPSQNRPAPVEPQHVSAGSKMVCEGGVCRLVPQNQHYKSSPYVTRVASRATIGSPEEWSDPPPPIGDTDPKGPFRPIRPLTSTVSTPVVPARAAPTPTMTNTASSNLMASKENSQSAPVTIPWESEPENPIGFIQNSVASSTLDHNSRLQPVPEGVGEGTGEANGQAQSYFKKLPSGSFVSESTASKKTYPQPMAQLTSGAPPWQGRGGVPQNVDSNFVPFSNRVGQDRIASSSKSKLMNMQSVGFGSMDKAPQAPMLSGPELEEIQFIKVNRFNLDYGIDAIDPSGVEKVVLWMTRDGGQNWESWGTDPDSVSPFPVNVDEAGTYGFRIVVHSRDGLTGLAPKRGDAADVYINFDNRAPLAHITSVPYGRGNEAGRLVINWKVEDSYLALRPITLSSSTDPAGPWTIIGDGLRNTGKYVWKVDTDVPEKIFLRLEARDKAGNIGVFQLSHLIDISGLVPRGRIRAVRPISN